MDEYIINSIKKFRIKNDVNTDVFIHEYYTYTYNKVKYIDIYVYKKDKDIGCININNLLPIYINFIEDNVNVLTYKYNDIKDNMSVTSYYDLKNKKHVKLDNANLIDYNDYITDNNSVNLLKKLDLKGFPDVVVVPKTTKNYYICACGTVNTGNECSNCFAPKKFIKIYDNCEKVNRAYAKKKFEKFKFNSVDINSELEDFKEELICDGEVNIDYIDNDFFESLNDEVELKITEFKNRTKINSAILRCVLIFIGIILIYAILSSIITNSKFKKSKEEFISKYCSDTKYKSRNIDYIINNYKCSDYVYYITVKNLDIYNIMSIINSNNTELYSLYYDIKKENLHETYINKYGRYESVNLERNDIFYNTTYLDYLYNNNYEIDSLTIDTILLKSVIDGDKELFVKYLKYVPLTKNKNWSYDGPIFSYYYNYYDNLETIVSKYNIDFKEFDLVDYAYEYHTIAKVNKCFDADLGDTKNIKKVMELGGKCSSNMLSYINNDTALDNYYNAGGDMNIAFEYSGNLFHKVVSSNNYDVSSFKEKVIKLKKYGVNINYEKKDTWDGATPLDVFISDNSNYSNCQYIKQGFSVSANGVKNCKENKEKYRILKQYGAVCKTKCEYEKYFR